MKIPFVDLKKQYQEIKEEIDKAIFSVLNDGAFIGGKYVQRFEEQFARYVGVRNCVGVGNGTDAIFVALKSLGIKRGDEVITVANSFIATAEAITMTGARVVFVDCDEDYYTINIHNLEKAITPKTKAIIPVHLYGQPADMDAILNMARTYGLFVIEDAAQAHGALYKRKRIGTLGDCACFSFFPGKNLGAYGDAGAIVTNNDEIARNARMFANHGRIAKYDHEFEGINSRLDGLQAAILEVKLRYLEHWTERRREIAKLYNEKLHDFCTIPKIRQDVRHVYHLYVVTVKEREKLMNFLKEKGISTGIHYPIPIPFLRAYSYLGHEPKDFPVAFSLKDEIVSFPIHGSMTYEQAGYVIKQIKWFMGNR